MRVVLLRSMGNELGKVTEQRVVALRSMRNEFGKSASVAF